MDTGSAAAYRRTLVAVLLVASMSVPPLLRAQDEPRELGMSVIGNRELPKSLVIVPWKAPQFEQRSTLSLQTLVGQALQPLDPELLRRQLREDGVDLPR